MNAQSLYISGGDNVGGKLNSMEVFRADKDPFYFDGNFHATLTLFHVHNVFVKENR